MSVAGHTSISHLQVFGRHVATIHMVKGAYASEHGSNEDIDNAIQRCKVLQHSLMNWYIEQFGVLCLNL